MTGPECRHSTPTMVCAPIFPVRSRVTPLSSFMRLMTSFTVAIAITDCVYSFRLLNRRSSLLALVTRGSSRPCALVAIHWRFRIVTAVNCNWPHLLLGMVLIHFLADITPIFPISRPQVYDHTHGAKLDFLMRNRQENRRIDLLTL